ncbi:xanthine dehydrogenase accessory protein XdhC [Mesobaculum littorinae]|uniref:Xanthine dehydrogenase accessory protein XdhC n=1 Tax=Mesobaculum littorinae TaxID=2486419 RepID=A0A438AGJ5_9RHOB|nr:xanthine dehydrogenase accessory protein XdhC [Mesobaculum littorinae]RVV97829.1 xanthine dehydrogenase accessory protein XdhC [Mesobaculum littorinae]
MSFDRQALHAAIAQHGRVARVVVAETRGSVPREVGAAMLVWSRGQSGTIGGGTLEFEAAARARAALETKREMLERLPLGPAMGQCCGGAVTLLTELWDAERLEATGRDVIARPAPAGEVGGSLDRAPGGTVPEMPLTVARALARARATGRAPGAAFLGGWMIEPETRPDRQIWLWGAGHVGRAIAQVVAPLPGFAITWIDTAADRFPGTIPDWVTPRVAPEPGPLVSHAPATAEHLILTFSHALDLDLCHRLLGHGFGMAGLIGSATKWARFRSRLRQLGHADAQIDRICCPIGRPELGKHPQAIAVGVAAALISPATGTVAIRGTG